MIITIVEKDNTPQVYSFKDRLVHLGRSPATEPSLQVDSQSVSRNHLAARVSKGRLQIKDLKSSNGTFLNEQKLEPDVWITVQPDDKINIAQFEGHLLFTVRQETLQKEKKSVKRSNRQQDCSDRSSRSRSRDKEKKEKLPFKISESTLKMLKDMTVNKKSKEERIKFLKLMGISKAQAYWDEIESVLKSKKGSEGQKRSQELERQFSSGRTAGEKRGLGH